MTTDSELIYNCPGCGKPARAPEGATVNECEYCALLVRVAQPGAILKYFYAAKLDAISARNAADRYLKQIGQPLTGSIIDVSLYYLPFYRFRGLAIDYVHIEELEEIPETDGLLEKRNKYLLKGKDFDITIPAYNEPAFALVSLGIRPAAVPLFAARPESKIAATVMVGTAIPPEIARQTAINQHKANMAFYNRGESLCRAMIGEQISLIYFPVYVINHEFSGVQKSVFVDALAGRGYHTHDSAFRYNGPLSIQKHSSYMVPQRHQCPNCGADLPKSQFSLYFPCKNCSRAFLFENSGLTLITPLIATTGAVAPYWRFGLEIRSEKVYTKVSDFSELLVSEISLMQKEKRDNLFYAYAPAFRSGDVSRWAELSLKIFRSQPSVNLQSRIEIDSLDVTISSADARAMAAFLWNVLTCRYSSFPDYAESIEHWMSPNGELVWLPFVDSNLLSKAKAYRPVNTIDK